MKTVIKIHQPLLLARQRVTNIREMYQKGKLAGKVVTGSLWAVKCKFPGSFRTCLREDLWGVFPCHWWQCHIALTRLLVSVMVNTGASTLKGTFPSRTASIYQRDSEFCSVSHWTFHTSAKKADGLVCTQAPTQHISSWQLQEKIK